MPPTSIVRKAFLKLGLIFLFLHHSVIGFDEISLNEFEQVIDQIYREYNN